MKNDHLTWKGLLGWVILISLILFVSNLLSRDKKVDANKVNTVIDYTVTNDFKEYIKCCGLENPYKLEFVKIKSIGFGTDSENLFVRYNLNGKLPNNATDLPKIKNDRIKGVIYYMALDENYWDGRGVKNPENAEAMVRIGFYGVEDETNYNNKIKVDGQVIEGGPGSDYFVVRFKYSQLILNQISSNVVMQAWSIAPSVKYPTGASKSELRNLKLAVSKDALNKIKIKLNLKPMPTNLISEK